MQDWANTATVALAVVTTLTLLVLIFYTRETYRLRQAAQRQNEISLMPIVVMTLASLPRGLNEPEKLEEPVVTNFGNGPAFNIEVEPLRIDEFEIRFAPLRFLPSGAGQKLTYRVSQDGQTGGMAEILIILTNAITSSQDRLNLKFSVTASDCGGTRYDSDHSLTHDPVQKKTGTTFYRQQKIS